MAQATRQKTYVTASITPVNRPQLSQAALDPTADGCSYLYFASDLVHEGPNNNRDIFVREEMEGAWQSIIGTPLDKDHELSVDGIVGSYIDAAYSVRGGRGVIRVIGAINETYYPEVAWKVRSGILTGDSMECLFDRGELTASGRILRGVQFVGGGLTRMPADPRALIEDVSSSNPPAAQASDAATRRRRLLLAASLLAATERTVR